MIQILSTRAPAPVRLARDVKPRVGNVEVGANPSAPLVLTWERVHQRADEVDSGIQSMDTDVKDKIVWTDPASLRASAAVYADLAASAPTDDIRKAQQAIADSLNGDADRLDARAAAEKPGQAAKDEDFGTRWESFVSDWNTLHQHVAESDTAFGGWFTATGPAWDAVGAADDQYRAFLDEYQKMGHKPPYVPPKPPAPTDWGMYAGWALVVAGIAAVAWLLSSARAIV